MSKQVRDLYGHEAEYNPRDITEESLAGLDQTIREYGDLSGVLFNVRTGRLFGGHQRKKVLPAESEIFTEPYTDDSGTVAVGYIETPHGRFSYREVDWDESKEKAANLVANAAGGHWNEVRRKDLIAELAFDNYDLSLLGHTNDQIEDILGLDSDASLDDIMNLSENEADEDGEEIQEDIQQEDNSGENLNKLTRIDANVKIYQLQALDRESDGANKRSKLLQFILDEWMEQYGIEKPS